MVTVSLFPAPTPLLSRSLAPLPSRLFQYLREEEARGVAVEITLEILNKWLPDALPQEEREEMLSGSKD